MSHLKQAILIGARGNTWCGSPVVQRWQNCQHPRCSSRCLQDCSSLHFLTPQRLWLVWSYSENNQDWSFPRWICRYTYLKSQQSSSLAKFTRLFLTGKQSIPNTKLAYQFARAKTHQRTRFLKVILWVHFKNPPSISLNRVYFLFLCLSTEQYIWMPHWNASSSGSCRGLLKGSGAWCRLLSLTSIAPQTGYLAHKETRYTYTHIQMRDEWGLWNGKVQRGDTSQGLMKAKKKSNVRFKSQKLIKK